MEKLNALRDEKNYNYLIEVDGGVSPEHVKPCLDKGVDVFVAGTAYFKGNADERSKLPGQLVER